MEELKKEFFETCCKRNNKSSCWEYLLPPENVWQFIEGNFVPITELVELQEIREEDKIYFEQLKAENEKLKELAENRLEETAIVCKRTKWDKKKGNKLFIKRGGE